MSNKVGMNDPVYGAHLQKGAGNTRPNAAAQREEIIRNMYRRVFVELAANRFKWEGLPDEIDVRFMELTLLRSGLSVFFKDDEFGKYFAAAATPWGMRNFIDEPIGFTITGRGAYSSRSIKATDCVPIWANYTQVPDVDIIELYAQKLANLDRSIEIASKNLRRSRLLIGNKNVRNTLVNVSRQIDEGQPVIGVGTNYDTEAIKEIDMGGSPDALEKLQIARTREWNMAMGLLGINHANQDKKERLVSDEVAANDEQVTAMKFVNLNARRAAAEEISEMIGSEVKVTFHTENDVNTDEPPAPPAPEDDGDMIDSDDAPNSEDEE